MKRLSVALALWVFCTLASAQTSAAAPPAHPILVIQSTPGGAQVYVDDELLGTTGPDGRLRISTLKPGKHTLRLSLGGQSYGQGEINLVAGKSLTKAVTLDGQATVANPTAKTTSPQTAPVSDTLAWIGGHFEAIVQNISDDTVRGSTTQTTSIAYQGCQVTLTSSIFGHNEWKNGERSRGTNTSVNGPFDLSSLSPDKTSTLATASYFTLFLSSTNPISQTYSMNSMRANSSGVWGQPENDPGSPVAVYKIGILFATQDMADRQAKAWHDAIIGCGGKPVSDKLY
jgi:hypothetical protein